MALSLQSFMSRKTGRIWKEGGREVKMRTAERVQQFRFVALVFALVFLACMDALASDVERQIPVTRDTAGTGLTVEISREGSRQTATPFLAINDPTAQRIEERITKQIDRLAAKDLPSEATVAGSVPGIVLTGTPREDSARSESALSSLPPVPGEITVRSVKSFLKRLRASRKEKPAPAVAAAPPEQRFGSIDTSLH